MIRYLAALLFFIAIPAFAAPTVQAIAKTARGDVPLTLEYAVTQNVREEGLMHRKTLKPADGMLFVFPEIGPHQFWMKNTIIPLDMLFLNKDGLVLAMVTGTPMSQAPLGPKDLPIQSVIELDAGRAVKEKIMVGTRIIYSLPEGVHVE